MTHNERMQWIEFCCALAIGLILAAYSIIEAYYYGKTNATGCLIWAVIAGVGASGFMIGSLFIAFGKGKP